MVMMGMDPDVVENIGVNLNNQASSIQQVITAINGLISQAEANWKGADSDGFRDLWQGQYQSQLTTMQNAINELGNTAKTQAMEQRSASGA